MENDLRAGKVAMVTGAAGGIGTAIARAFAADGYAVALVDLDADAVGTLAEDPELSSVGAIGIDGDLGDAEGCEAVVARALERLGRIDVLVNNAGVGAFAALPELSVAEIDKVLDVNERAAILVTRAVLPQMIERASGSIVSMSSAAAKFGYADLAPYSASKAALIGFTRALAIELAPKGIRVNAVCPGPTNTAMMAANVSLRMEETGLPYEEALKAWTDDIPTKRMIEPEDIADAVFFLASERARCITGEAINVSSGMVMW